MIEFNVRDRFLTGEKLMDHLRRAMHDMHSSSGDDPKFLFETVITELESKDNSINEIMNELELARDVAGERRASKAKMSQYIESLDREINSITDAFNDAIASFNESMIRIEEAKKRLGYE